MDERTPIDPTSRYTYITDVERKLMEAGAHQFYTSTGQLMRIPPTLYDKLKSGGVDMRYILADKSLEQ